MDNYYIYRFNYIEGKGTQERKVSATVIFCDRDSIDENHLKADIREFYENNYQTDKIFIIGGRYLEKEMLRVFEENLDQTFISVPKREDTSLKENLYILSFDRKGKIKSCNGKAIPLGFQDYFLNEGTQNIFNKRGGLITTPGSHHFVFPSGKHCDKFLRTGNVLLVSSEIYFIAFALLKYYDFTKFSEIYCDTSSINSVALALSDLKNRFLKPKDKRAVPIKSFKSYEGLYQEDLKFNKHTFVIVSATTSANMVGYILKRHGLLRDENVAILYFIGDQAKYSQVKSRVVCNLTRSEENPNGIPYYDTHKEDKCVHCSKGSYPVSVSGDIFLLEKPKINRVILSIKDAEKNLSDFVFQFKSRSRKETVLKVSYKEGVLEDSKYDVYIDYCHIIDGIEKREQYSDHKSKLDNYVNQYVPSNVKYLIHLNDSGSKKLAEYILSKIEGNYSKGKTPKVLSQDKIGEIVDSVGSILVVGSCISNGKNLLYISRTLRKYADFGIIYFIGISRMRNRHQLGFLKSNLKQGQYGQETNSFVEVESLFCNNSSKATAWIKEIEFLKKFLDFLYDECPDAQDTADYIRDRQSYLAEGFGDKERGLSEGIFYPCIRDGKTKELRIRKNFAYFDFNSYDKHVTQSDIYFTISNVINSLRNSEKSDRTLHQTAFVRSLIDPSNFNRFNDGIIQASILRSASPEELSYFFDNEISQEMYAMLETLIKYSNDEQGEALVEFLYAIASKKLTLANGHTLKLVNLLDTQCQEELIKCFSKYIRKIHKESEESQHIKVKDAAAIFS